MTEPNAQPPVEPGTPPAAAPVPAAAAPETPPATEPPATPAPAEPPAEPSQQTLPNTPTEPTQPAAPQPTAAPKGKGGKWLKIPAASFTARVKRDAESQVQTRFGMSLDEATRLIEVGKKAEKGLLDNEAATNETVKNLQAELASAQKRLDKATRALADGTKKHKREVRRLKDRQIESDLKATAAREGIKDVDYALHLYAKHRVDGQTTAPKEFFGGLKASHAFLFGANGAPPEPEPITPSTAPPASAEPGEATPDPAEPGTPTPSVNVEDMDNRDFSKHAQSKYGFTPGMG